MSSEPTDQQVAEISDESFQQILSLGQVQKDKRSGHEKIKLVPTSEDYDKMASLDSIVFEHFQSTMPMKFNKLQSSYIRLHLQRAPVMPFDYQHLKYGLEIADGREWTFEMVRDFYSLISFGYLESADKHGIAVPELFRSRQKADLDLLEIYAMQPHLLPKPKYARQPNLIPHCEQRTNK